VKSIINSGASIGSQKNVVTAFKEYKGRLTAFVRKRLAIKDDAEDIVQEFFYQFSHMNDLAKPVEQTAAWLFRVARNMIINAKKKKSAVPFSALAAVDDGEDEDLSDFIDILCADETTPETETLRAFVWDEIEAVLDELPEAQRDVFIQTEFLDMPVKEISKKSGVPVNTLLSRKHYAVKALRKKLKDLYAEICYPHNG
jgi:RNA polymerase sigma factor (sigma-70 family)